MRAKRSADGSKAAGSKSRRATANTRIPSDASRSFSLDDALAEIRDRLRSAVDVEVPGRPSEEHVRCSLHEATHHTLDVVERRHELVLRVERHFADTRVDSPGLLDVEPALGGEHDECSLGRIADARAVADDSVVRQRHRQHEVFERLVADRLTRGTDAQDATGRRVALAVDAVVTAREHELARSHLVQRQRARLVGADRRGRAEGLDRPQLLDDRSLGRERLGAEREQHRHHGGQAGRDRGDREADADGEELVEVIAPREPDDHDRDEGHRGHDRDDHRELIELLREWGLLLLDPAQHPRDVSDLGGHAGRGDEHLATPARDLRVHVGHVDAIAERDIGALDGPDRLRYRRALAGEPRLLDLERRRHHDPPVRGHLVAGFEHDDVARNQLLGRHLDALSVAADVRVHDEHLPERSNALGGLALLVQAHDRVDHSEPDHDESRRHVLQGDDRHDRGAQEHELHEVAVLAQRTPSSPAPSPPRRACSARGALGVRAPRSRSARTPDRPRAAGTSPRPRGCAIDGSLVGVRRSSGLDTTRHRQSLKPHAPSRRKVQPRSLRSRLETKWVRLRA